jgi:hypothetical protein
LPLIASFEDVRSIATSLPEVEEVLTWGTDVTFRVRKKIFAIGGEGSDGVSIKASLERQADLLALDSETFKSSAYVGRFGWVNVRLDRIDDALLRELIVDAWRSVAPKRLLSGSVPEDVG